jgi:hypothetical protein
MRGCFRRPPLAANGLLYAVDTDGKLIAVSPRTGAMPGEIATLKYPAASFNRGVIVDATDRLGAVHGWTYLAVSPTAVEAVSLATSQVTTLYEAPAATPIVANASEADSTGFKGMVATGTFCAFASRTSAAEISLTIRYFSNERSIEQALKISGTKLIGPALHEGLILICSDEQAGIYDPATTESSTVQLPGNFRPLLNRTNRGVFVPPGGMPLTCFLGASGREAWIAGYEVEKSYGNEQLTAGMLQILFDENRATFKPFPEFDPACVSTNSDGSLCISTPAEVESIGRSSVPVRVGKRLGGMPVSYQSGVLTYFAEDPDPGWHRIVLSSDAGTADGYFEDAQNECNTDSCCGIFLYGRDVVVPYLDISSDPERYGLKFAHWNFAQ